MQKMFRYICLGAVVAMFASCIENDIPYPVVKLDIVSLEADGLLSEPVIDAAAHTVKLELEETTDIRKVNISNVVLTEGATSDVTFPGIFDMRNPLYANLTKYETTAEWTITAAQQIERYFSVDGQMGEAEIDPDGCVVTVYVPMDHDLNNVSILSAKFGPKDITTYSPDPLTLTSFYDTVRHVEVKYHGDIVEDWTIRVIPKDLEIEMTQVDAWAKRIWVKAVGRAGSELGFRYRLAGSETWIDVADVTVDGGNISACIENLEALTSYEVVAYSGDNESDVYTVTTEDVMTLINGGFEDWSLTDGTYYPYLEGGEPFWATGNDGAKVANTILTEPTNDVRPGTTGKSAAALQSKKAALMGIGKFAAGNIFLGRFGGLKGINGLVFFGRPSTARPVALRGWVKYNQGMIDELGTVPTSRPDLKKGDPDEGQIFIAVGDWTAEEYGGDADSPVSVDTSDESTFFDIKGKNVIGAGELILTESTDGWVEFTIPMDYTTTSRIPTHMIIVCTGSRFGDYFTGSTGSLMLVDDLELVY
ncbi:MAG: PCMD domain-containing protein [Alistipes sp.]|nr:PCMD domain-containing protein [Alistipes sp.]